MKSLLIHTVGELTKKFVLQRIGINPQIYHLWRLSLAFALQYVLCLFACYILYSPPPSLKSLMSPTYLKLMIFVLDCISTYCVLGTVCHSAVSVLAEYVLMFTIAMFIVCSVFELLT